MSQKQHLKESPYRAKSVLELVHSDVRSPIPTPTFSGKKYFVTFIDNYSIYTHVYLLGSKTQVVAKCKEHMAAVDNKFQNRIKVLNTDNEGEWVIKELDTFLDAHGIKHRTTVQYSASQNGTAEIKNHSLLEMTKYMLKDSNLSDQFWGEVVLIAIYLQNRLLTTAHNSKPHEKGRKRSL